MSDTVTDRLRTAAEAVYGESLGGTDKFEEYEDEVDNVEYRLSSFADRALKYREIVEAARALLSWHSFDGPDGANELTRRIQTLDALLPKPDGRES